MKRRGVTVLIGCLLLALFMGQLGRVRVPYVELGPGPTVDTLGQSDGKPVINLQGAQSTDSKGQLRLVTVSVRSDLSLLGALRGWWDDDYAVVPRELVYPPDKSEDEVNDDNDREFKQSQSSAETAALRELGYPIEVAVTKVVDGTPAVGVLEPGDIVTALDGTKIASPGELSDLVRKQPPGTERTVTFRRGGEQRTARITTAKGDDGNARLGIEIEARQEHPFKLEIQLDRIGGPSAGLMFALGIIDKVKPEDLTGGMILAGTGTIDEDGKVGPIGGIQQKLVAAKAAGAKAFLTPEGNCEDAVASAPDGLPLVKVGSLGEALDALRALREKRRPPLCPR